MNILVTGCAGFIGSSVVEKLLSYDEIKIVGLFVAHLTQSLQNTGSYPSVIPINPLSPLNHYKVLQRTLGFLQFFQSSHF